MSTAVMVLRRTQSYISGWSWLKKTLMVIATLGFLVSNFLFLTPWGESIRMEMAGMVIITRHREWAWLAVGAKERDSMVNKMWETAEKNSVEKQDFGRVVVSAQQNTRTRDRTLDELIKVVDIKDEKRITPIWKGKMMYVYDPTTIRVVTTSHFQEGEKISDMVKRTGAVAGVNGGAFEDPEGLGNGFAPIGFIKSAGQLLYNSQEGSIPMQTVGFNKDGQLVIGKYSLEELDQMNVTDAVFWYPRMIANGKALEVSDVGRNPRTAIGQKADGTVIFIVIDGRSTTSVGATEKEVQDLLMAEGCENAGFLDGGASSELVVQGEVLTKPSSKYGERRLPSAFLVFDHPEDYKPIRIWDGLTKIDAGGSYDHPDFLKEQAELRAKGLLNTPTPKPAATPTPTATHTPEPSRQPTDEPKASPSASATPGKPSGSPTAGPSGSATPAPGSGGASPTPSASTSPSPSPSPTTSPSATPTATPQASSATPAGPTATATPAVTATATPKSTAGTAGAGQQ